MSKEKPELKKQWLKENYKRILVIAFIVVLLFAGAVILHKFYLTIIGIIVGFLSFFYYRNKMAAYIEKKL